MIYAHENIYGGDWSDVNFTGGPGSSYFQGGIFGFTENLNYFLNGEFPIDEALSEGSSFAVGATSDRIVLEAGDFIDQPRGCDNPAVFSHRKSADPGEHPLRIVCRCDDCHGDAVVSELQSGDYLR